MVGPLKKAPGGFEWLLVAIDKFTKWIEVMPLVKHSSRKAVDFVESIIHHFGVPHRIITDLGSDFTGREFCEYCDNLGIDVCFASTRHPQANGQAVQSHRTDFLFPGLRI